MSETKSGVTRGLSVVTGKMLDVPEMSTMFFHGPVKSAGEYAALGVPDGVWGDDGFLRGVVARAGTRFLGASACRSVLTSIRDELAQRAGRTV